MKYATLDELREAVERNQGVLTEPMQEIRDAHGAGRLGIHVRTNISKALKGLGLSHYPEALPEYQHVPVRVYKQGSPVGDLIDAVLNPSPTHDDELRQAVSGGDAELLRQVRELICG
ncbi:MAG: hypothetical protein HY240_06870 [Actinobacteria bacterium]|nr:hypothetical protein [Actinomycetota bacterium]